MAKFNYKKAKESGYSDEEISKFLSEQNPGFKYQEAKDAGYSDAHINRFLAKEQEPKGIKSGASALLKGIAEGAYSMNPMGQFGPVSLKMGKRAGDEFLPSSEEHEYIRRAGKLIPVVATGEGSIPLKAAELAAGTLGGEVAKEGGFGEIGQTVMEALSMGIPGLAKGAVEKTMQAISSEPSKMVSGLTKPSAVEAKSPRWGTISKERQAAVIEKLDKEASELTQKSVEKHLPAHKKLENKVDFDSKFKKDFGELKSIAEKSNPDMDITPISNLIKESAGKYRGIPRPSSEVKSIINEIKAFNKKPQTGLGNLLKIFRDNNKKMKHVYETAMTGGRQEEYVDFLKSMNRAITESFERTLPSDSAWLNQFRKLNKDFKELRDAEKTIGRLKGILSGRPKSAEIEKLASDVKTQERLRLSMGDQGSSEVIQIAKDLKEVRQSLKKIPSKRYNKFDHAFPLYYLIPFVGKALGIHKTAQAARYFYGWLLSTPSRRKAYSEALKAFSNNDLEGYKKATYLIESELNKD